VGDTPVDAATTASETSTTAVLAQTITPAPEDTQPAISPAPTEVLGKTLPKY
jgi:hypothetical protein